jgi:hypothetical protein
MAHKFHDPRTRAVPDELRAFVQSLVEEHGARSAARLLDLGKNTVLSVIAGQDAMPGTIALIRQARAGKHAA